MTAKERPILFSGDMVRAILDGRKTMTRRVVKIAQHPQAERVQHFEGLRWDWLRYDGLRLATFKCPYGKEGDRLWVRESFCEAFSNYEEGGEQTTVYYRADGQEVVVDDGDGYAETNKDGTLKSPWKPSIHMPRWASRITLEITDIRVERLQDISEEDAQAEGAPLELGVLERTILGAKARYRSGFVRLWESINGPGSWDANPWVWCISFKRVTP